MVTGDQSAHHFLIQESCGILQAKGINQPFFHVLTHRFSCDYFYNSSHNFTSQPVKPMGAGFKHNRNGSHGADLVAQCGDFPIFTIGPDRFGHGIDGRIIGHMIKRSHTVGKAAGHGKGVPDGNWILNGNNLRPMPRNLNIFGGVFPFRKKIIYRICKTEEPFLKKHHADGIGKKLRCGRLSKNRKFIDFASLFNIGVT